MFFPANVQWPKGARMWACTYEGVNVHKAIASNIGMGLRLNKQTTSVCGQEIPTLMGSDKQGLSHWVWRSPEERLQGLCCRMHTRCVREHIPPTTPCPWRTCRHRQSTCWGKGRRVWKAVGTQAEGMKWHKIYQITLLMGPVSVCTWNWKDTDTPALPPCPSVPAFPVGNVTDKFTRWAAWRYN